MCLDDRGPACTMLGGPAHAWTGWVFVNGESGVVLSKPSMTKHHLDGACSPLHVHILFLDEGKTDM
jgi:hypothetical protein